MSSRLSHTSVDCRDAYAQSTWWTQVIDFAEDPGDPNEPGDEECLLISADGHQRVLFIEVPEAQQVKNRLHVDLAPLDRTRDAEVERVLGLGARTYADLRRPDGTGWVTLLDPEGNEFCILRSDAERQAGADPA